MSVLLILLLACASRCEQACTLMHHGGERDCVAGGDPGSVLVYGDDGLADNERQCVDLCTQSVEANDRDADDARKDWADCVLDEKQSIRKDAAKYGEADADACAEALGECRFYPCSQIGGTGRDVECLEWDAGDTDS